MSALTITRRALVGRILASLRPHRAKIGLATLCAIAEAALALIPIVALKALIDELSSADPAFANLVWPVVATFGAVLLATAIGVAATYLVTQLGEGVVFGLRRDLVGHLLGQSTTFYSSTRGGDVLSRVLNDVAGVNASLSSHLMTGVRSGLSIASTSVLMLVLDWRLAILALVLLPAVVLAVRSAGRRIGRAQREVQDQLSAMTSYLQETLGLSGILLVRAFGRYDAERRRFDTVNAELRDRQVTRAMTARTFTAGLAVVGAVAPALILLLGGYLVSIEQASVGTVLVFGTVIAARLGGSVQQLASAAAAMLGSLVLWRRIFETLDAEPGVAESPGARTLHDVRGVVTLDAVTFTYPGQGTPAVGDVSVEIRPGQLVALVGPSGAGKTTLAALIARLVDPDAGSVRLDGHDLRDLTLQTVSSSIGLVFQDTFLFHTTLAENLRYGRPEASDAEIEAAIHDAQLDDLLATLPDGLDTVLGERGHRLSGGEKQRVALARTILKDPRVLVLDEATAHLDTLSELRVQQGLQRLYEGRTSIVIAHRLSTIEAADLVLVLDDGRIVERGTPAQLLSSGGLFAHLRGLQGIA